MPKPKELWEQVVEKMHEEDRATEFMNGLNAKVRADAAQNLYTQVEKLFAQWAMGPEFNFLRDAADYYARAHGLAVDKTKKAVI